MGKYWKPDALRDIAIAQANLSDFKAADETVRQIEQTDQKEDALRGIAVAHASAGDKLLALQTANGIDDKYQQFHAFRGIAVALAKRGDLPNALVIVRNHLVNDGDQGSAYGAIAAEQATTSDLAGAQTTLGRAVTENAQAWAYTRFGARLLQVTYDTHD